jgi:hypothetical protein
MLEIGEFKSLFEIWLIANKTSPQELFRIVNSETWG